MYKIADIKAINREKGQYFFSRNTMKFFASKVLPYVYEGKGGIYFVTSEKMCFEDYRRVFTVRKFYPETGGITSPIPEKFSNSTTAKAWAKKLSLEGLDS